jgi:hypothetical protein
MSESSQQVDLSGERLTLGSARGFLSKTGFGAGVFGILATVAAIFALGTEARSRALQSYLVAYCYFLSLTLGALFFVLIQHLTRAGWSVVVRRLAEGFTRTFVLLAVLILPIVLGMREIFEWTHPEVAAGSPLLQSKRFYLNTPFFLSRLAFYFAAWILLSEWLSRRSLEQDRTGDPAVTTRMQKVAAPSMFLFALTTTFVAFDLLMSLEWSWYSTIFGVYFFSGSVLGFFALLPLTSFLLQRSGRLTGVISTEHYHDMGKLMFAFVVFWSYIAFSQYMLYWYANIPEETAWFLQRQTGEWTAFSYFMLLGHFLVPFLALISRTPKRRPWALSLGACWVLLVHWADLYYLAMPRLSEGKVPFHILDLTTFVAVGGLWVGVFALRMRQHSLIPERDPRLPESLAFENF